MVTIKSKKEIEYMKEACKVVALMYKELEEKIHQNQYLTELREKIKQAQKEAVHFAHYDKPAAEQEPEEQKSAAEKEQQEIF